MRLRWHYLLLVVTLVSVLVSAAALAQVTGVTAGPARLVTPPDSTAKLTLAYGLGFPLQIAPTRAAVLCNRRVEGVPIFDFENGTDVIIFDSLTGIRGKGAVAVSRNEIRQEGDAGKRIAVKYPITGGFVPLGALRADGTPHPHAGTGFGLCQVLSFPVDDQGHFSWSDKFVHRCEVHQFSYDGEQFQSVRSASGLEQPWPAAGVWQISAPGLTNAIPDGDDLLLPVTATDGSGSYTGVSRWSRAAGTWQPVAFSPVTPREEDWAEPSLVRDSDGGLLFSARGSGGERFTRVQVWRRQGQGPQWQLVVSTDDVRVWHKREQGPEWGLIISLPNAHNEGPISIGRAADGTPYLAANQPGSGRQTLCLWPLNAERMDLGKPLVVRAARDEFGPAPAGGTWLVDHPSAAVLRLADGQWHGVLAYRVLGSAEHQGAPPAPQTGWYLDEVRSSGAAVPPWRFE